MKSNDKLTQSIARAKMSRQSPQYKSRTKKTARKGAHTRRPHAMHSTHSNNAAPIQNGRQSNHDAALTTDIIAWPSAARTLATNPAPDLSAWGAAWSNDPFLQGQNNHQPSTIIAV